MYSRETRWLPGMSPSTGWKSYLQIHLWFLFLKKQSTTGKREKKLKQYSIKYGSRQAMRLEVGQRQMLLGVRWLADASLAAKCSSCSAV